MRVLLINKRAPFDGLGAERVIWDIGNRFAAEGHDVTFFCPTPDDAEVPDREGVSFNFVDIPGGETRKQIEFFLRAAPKYRAVYNEVDPDLVYDNPSPFPFHLAHFCGEAPVVSKVHTIYRRDAFLAKDHPLVKVGTIVGEETYRLFRNELFTPVSHSTAGRLESLVHTGKNKIVTNLNGTDTTQFEFSFDSDSKQVIYLSKLGRKKGIKVLLRAWEEIEAQPPDANLVVAGSGPLEADAKALADRLELSRVEFAGYVSESRKKELFRESLIYTLPTYIEGMPLTPLEAMASGCAVVSTDTYGVRDIITDGESGRLVPTGDQDALADALLELLDDPDRVGEFAERGAQRAGELSLDRMLDAEMEIVKDWLAERKRA